MVFVAGHLVLRSLALLVLFLLLNLLVLESLYRSFANSELLGCLTAESLSLGEFRAKLVVRDHSGVLPKTLFQAHATFRLFVV